MLINLSNHPSARWGTEQKEAASSNYGDIVDLEFPDISPDYTYEQVYKLAQDFLLQCEEILPSPSGTDAVHLTGEIVFCAILSRLLLQKGYAVVCSTTRRVVDVLDDGTILRRFKFVAFREYGKPMSI